MRVPQAVRDCVVYLYDGDELLGTGFCVGIPETDEPTSAVWNYIVTARHVVQGIPSPIIRTNSVSGEAIHIQTSPDNWWHSHDPTADVASAFLPAEPDFKPTVVRPNQIADDEFLVVREVGPGDEVVFTGLFQGAAGESRNLPIVRWGHIARMNEELVQTESPSGDIEEIDAIMVEAHSWGGHSGSPAIVLFPFDRWMDGVTRIQVPTDDPRTSWALLGLVSSHWDLPSPVKMKNAPRGRDPEREALVNAGIALVVPGQHILDLLFRDDIATDRKRRQAQGKGPRPTAAQASEQPEGPNGLFSRGKRPGRDD